MPVVVVDGPPGAEVMPAEPGFGAPTGGFVPTPGALPIVAPAPGPCAKADAVAPIRVIAMNAQRCSLCRMTDLQFLIATQSTCKESRRSSDTPVAGITLVFCGV
jgi:hypothetical protein